MRTDLCGRSFGFCLGGRHVDPRLGVEGGLAFVDGLEHGFVVGVGLVAEDERLAVGIPAESQPAGLLGERGLEQQAVAGVGQVYPQFRADQGAHWIS